MANNGDAAEQLKTRIDGVLQRGEIKASEYDEMLVLIDRDGGYSNEERKQMQRLLDALADGSVRYKSGA